MNDIKKIMDYFNPSVQRQGSGEQMLGILIKSDHQQGDQRNNRNF